MTKPDEKHFPVPLMITALTAESSSRRSSAFCISSSSSLLKAFILSGRLNVKVATCSSTATMMVL
jgi:hypothetical protein